jgi:hypothetical protein
MQAELCGKECHVYSRVVGYFRPVQNWNFGKQEEFKDRKEFDQKIALDKEMPNLLKKDNCDCLKATAASK